MNVPLDERVGAWFASAEADVRVAETIAGTAPHIACFHAQQGAEKALKGLLTRLSDVAPPLHALVRLLQALDALTFDTPPDVRSEAETLDKFYIPTRYPDALGFVDAALAYKRRDADAAIASARLVFGFARRAADERAQ